MPSLAAPPTLGEGTRPGPHPSTVHGPFLCWQWAQRVGVSVPSSLPSSPRKAIASLRSSPRGPYDFVEQVRPGGLVGVPSGLPGPRQDPKTNRGALAKRARVRNGGRRRRETAAAGPPGAAAERGTAATATSSELSSRRPPSRPNSPSARPPARPSLGLSVHPRLPLPVRPPRLGGGPGGRAHAATQRASGWQDAEPGAQQPWAWVRGASATAAAAAAAATAGVSGPETAEERGDPREDSDA